MLNQITTFQRERERYEDNLRHHHHHPFAVFGTKRFFKARSFPNIHWKSLPTFEKRVGRIDWIGTDARYLLTPVNMTEEEKSEKERKKWSKKERVCLRENVCVWVWVCLLTFVFVFLWVCVCEREREREREIEKRSNERHIKGVEKQKRRE